MSVISIFNLFFRMEGTSMHAIQDRRHRNFGRRGGAAVGDRGVSDARPVVREIGRVEEAPAPKRLAKEKDVLLVFGPMAHRLVLRALVHER